MAPVHLYLAAWVAGGVLLGATMLLDAREPDEPERALEDADPARHGSLANCGDLRKAPGLLARWFRVLPLGLIGFGLSGLLAKGLELDLWPWTFVTALSIGMSLIALGYGLSRSRV